MRYCAPHGLALSAFLSWPEADQDAALAWSAHEAQRCSTCGTHPDDWTADRDAWHAELTRCAGCERLEQLRESDAVKGTGRGVKLALSHGSAGDCPRCNEVEEA